MIIKGIIIKAICINVLTKEELKKIDRSIFPHLIKLNYVDKLSNAAAEKANQKNCVTGIKASMPGVLVIIFLGTTIVSPGSSQHF